MQETIQLQLKRSALLSVPFQSYPNDFTFIVNDVEYQTSRFVSDLISPIICKNHLIDPLLDNFIIKTQNQGNFSHVLNLLSFSPTNIPLNELQFIAEVMNCLGNESIDFIQSTELTTENVFSEMLLHQKYSLFFSSNCQNEINFISSHFFEIEKEHREEILQLDKEILYQILSNNQLRIESEDQVLNFINDLYLKDHSYSDLYDTVLFMNVSTNSIDNFLDIFDINDISSGTWKEISKRLREKAPKDPKTPKERYQKYISKDKPLRNEIAYSTGKEFQGIINYLNTKSNNAIENEINFTSSTYYSESHKPINVANQSQSFFFAHLPNSWICLEFNNYLISPTHYALKTVTGWSKNKFHLKEWVLEASNNSKSWTVLDEVKNSDALSGQGLMHTFEIRDQPKEFFKYIRLRMTGPGWSNCFLGLESMELFGTLMLN